MTDYQKLKSLIDEIDVLISSDCDSSDTTFITWYDKAELFVCHMFGRDSLEYSKFLDITYHETDYGKLYGYSASINQVAVCKKGLNIAKSLFLAFLEDIPEASGIHDQPTQFNSKKIFIVHGHDGELKHSVARIIEQQGIEAVILSEQANQGRTIIEKFEDYSDVGGAICLFTADDFGRSKKEDADQNRARQNVVFETGFFMGNLGRKRVVILADSGIEVPSDLSGVVYTSTANWQFDLLKELNAMGYSIDLNKLL